MTKKETTEEKLVKLMLLQNMEQTKLYISFYESEYSFYNKLYSDMEDEEPLKIFKKKHNEWETKRKELYSHICDIESKKMELYEELGHLMDEVYDTKKEPSKKDC